MTQFKAIDLLPNNSIFQIQVLTDSMAPQIIPADTLLIHKSDYDDLRVGEIVLIKINNTTLPIIHRLVKKIKKNGKVEWITQGDKIDYQDSQRLTRSRFLGKMIYKKFSIIRHLQQFFLYR